MLYSLNTVVEADPNSCRAAADWLGKLCDGVHDIGTGLHKAESNSESVWKGDAGDAFRDLVSGNAGDADQVAEFLNRTKIAVEKFADEITTIRNRIDQARRVAKQGGLTVTPTTVEEPPTPQVELYSPAPGAEALGHNDRTPEERRILEEYQNKVDVWNEAVDTVHDARDEEKSAHDTLRSDIDMNKSIGDYLVPQGWAWAPMLTGVYSGPYMTAKAMTEAAATAQARAEGALALLDDPSLSAADRQKVLSNQVVWAGKVKAAQTAAQSAVTVDTRVPGPGAGKELVGKSIKGVGIIGGIVTVYSVKKEIDAGVAADKAITKGGVQAATSGAVGLVMTGAAAAGYIGGVAATGGTLLVGTALAAGVGYYIDHHYYD